MPAGSFQHQAKFTVSYSSTMRLAVPNQRALDRARFHNSLHFILDFQRSSWPEPSSTAPTPQDLGTDDWLLAMMVMVSIAFLVTIALMTVK